MRKTIASTAVAAGLALGVAMGSSAKADPPTQALESSTSDLTSSAKPLPAPPVGKPAPQAKPHGQGQPTPQAAPTQQGMPPQGAQGPGMSAFEAAQAQAEAQANALFGAAQAQIADATGKLEAAFEQQFRQAEINREKLQHLIDQAVQAFPAPVRGQVQLHIDKVIATAEQVAPQMTQEQRDEAVAHPEELGKAQQGLITGWGWGAPYGFGGLGAFGFPGTYGAGWGWGGLGGWGSPYLWSYPAAGFGACGAGFCGAGLGAGGWSW